MSGHWLVIENFVVSNCSTKGRLADKMIREFARDNKL